jgi:hypothetical protein
MPKTVILDYPVSGNPQHQSEYAGKFLQFTWRKQEYLVFAPFELHRYHNQILGRFLSDNAVAHRWITKGMLEVGDPDLGVTGGGRFRVSLDRKVLELWDTSQAYGRFDENGLLEKIADAGHAWSGFRVKIF